MLYPVGGREVYDRMVERGATRRAGERNCE